MKGGYSSVDKLWIVVLIVCMGLFVAPHAASAVSMQAPEIIAAASEGIEITSINVTGLDKLDENIVISGLTIKAGDVLVGNATKKLSDAAEALYNTGWFRDKPVLSLDSHGQGAILSVEVVENPVYIGTRISGNSLFSTDRLLQEVEGATGADGRRTGGRLVRGRVICSRKLINALDGILGVYQDAGYIGAGVAKYSIITKPPETGMVEITITEGIVDEVIISGLDRTRESVVRRQITHLRSGSTLRRSDVERDLNQIYNTGLFESVVPLLEPSLKEGYVRVVIEVEEAPTGQAGFGLGYSTINGLQGSVNYREKNLFGRGKQIATTLTFTNSKPGFDVTYTDPYAAGRSFWGVGVYMMNTRQQRFPGTANDSELEIEKRGGNVFWGQKLNDFDSYQVSFGLADYDYEIIKGDPFRGTDPRYRARLAAEGQTRKVGTAFTRDTRDNVFDTTEGYMGKASGEIAGFGGDFSFNKWTLEGREFYRLGPGTLGLRQRTVFASGSLPIYEQDRLGGVATVRGVSEDQVTGSHSFLSNVEYRYKFNEMFGAVAFLDSGWAGESYGSMDGVVGAGIGARIKIKQLGLGAVRLDYGWELSGETGNNQRFHFFLGEMF